MEAVSHCRRPYHAQVLQTPTIVRNLVTAGQAVGLECLLSSAMSIISLSSRHIADVFLFFNKNSTPRPYSAVCLVPCRDEVNLFDPNGTLVTSAKWANSSPGAAIHLMPDGTYKLIPEDKNIIETLKALGDYDSFIAALKVGVSLQTAIASPSFIDIHLGEQVQRGQIRKNSEFSTGLQVKGVSVPLVPPEDFLKII